MARKLPPLQTPFVENSELARFLESLREYVDLCEGVRGDPKGRFVTVEDLELAGVVTTQVVNRRTSVSSGGPPPSLPSHTLGDHSDTNINAPKDKDVLTYDRATGKWMPKEPTSSAVDVEVFDDDSDGLVPASGGGTDNFLRADGTWDLPAALEANAAPTVSSISPNTANIGGPAFTLTVTGTGFIYWSIVLWGGSPRPTTYISDTELHATITADDIASGGDIDVTVISPRPGGGESDPEVFDVSATYDQLIIADAPLAYYRLGESAGSTLADQIDSPVQDGTVNGTAILGRPGAISGDGDTAIRVGSANGTNYLSFPITLDPTTNNGLAFELWLIIEGADSIPIRDVTSVAATGTFLMFPPAGKVTVRVDGNTFVSGIDADTYRDGNFHHYVAEYVHDTTTVNLYIDGDLADSGTIAAAESATVSEFRLFKNGSAPDQHMEGTGDEIAFYDRPLGSARVNAHYQKGIGA